LSDDNKKNKNDLEGKLNGFVDLMDPVEASRYKRYWEDILKNMLSESICYPPNNGLFAKLYSQPLKVGTVLDRYGSSQGTFLSPAGTPFDQRSLPTSSLTREYHRYEVLKEFTPESGIVASWFEQSGGGIQYYIGNTRIVDKRDVLRKLNRKSPIQDLIDNEYLIEK
jgi:hypothetical protein